MQAVGLLSMVYFIMLGPLEGATSPYATFL